MSLSLQSVSFRISGKPILSEISMELEAGQVLSLIGPNGAGKTHLLKLALGLIKPSIGSVTLEGLTLTKLSVQKRARKLSYIPQKAHFDWPLCVADLVALGLFSFPEFSLTKKKQLTEETLELCKLTPLANRSVTTLSGGEQARVAVARALVSRPSFLLADEPFMSLDIYHKAFVLDIFKSAQISWNMGLLVSLHDLEMAKALGGACLGLKSGECFRFGQAESLLTQPFVDALFDPDNRERLT